MILDGQKGICVIFLFCVNDSTQSLLKTFRCINNSESVSCVTATIGLSATVLLMLLSWTAVARKNVHLSLSGCAAGTTEGAPLVSASARSEICYRTVLSVNFDRITTYMTCKFNPILESYSEITTLSAVQTREYMYLPAECMRFKWMASMSCSLGYPTAANV